MKRMISAILGVAAMALASGCSDDSSDSGTISCTYSTGSTVVYCMSGPGKASDCTGTNNGVVVSSCPAGAVSTCTTTAGTQQVTLSFYDQTAATTYGVMCDQ